MQVINLEKASVNPKNMKRFAQDVKYLQIKRLAENVGIENPPESIDDLENADEISYESNNEDIKDQTKNADEIINLDIPGGDELGSGKQLYKCEECEASYNSRGGLYNHTSSKHKGIFYFCKHCSYKAHRRGIIKQHQDAIHEGVRYSCNQCNYYSTTQGSLKTHKKSIHYGVKYSCDKCDYQATHQSHLKTHEKSVHDSVKYFCDKCNHQARWKCELRKHVSIKHCLL